MPDTEELSAIAVDIGLKMHRDIGPGLLESAYEMILAEKLRATGLHVTGKCRSESSTTVS